LYNRLYLNPHITAALAGTALKYNFRGRQLKIDLSMDHYGVSNEQFAILSKKDFGFYDAKNELSYFDGSQARVSLRVETMPNSNLTLDIKTWDRNQRSWTQLSKDQHSNKLIYHVHDLAPNSDYTILVNNKMLMRIRSDAEGSLQFDHMTSKKTEDILIN
jgi:hypothetical protein